MPSTSNHSRHTHNRTSQSYPVTRSSSPTRRPDRQVPWTSAYYGSYDNDEIVPSWDDLGSPVELLSPEMGKPIVLEPSQSGTAAHLATLANAGYTLSPYTPSFDRIVVHRAKPHGQSGKPPSMGNMSRPPQPFTASSTDKTIAKESETGEPSPFTSPPTTSGSSPSSVLEIRVNRNGRIDEEVGDNSQAAPPPVQPTFKPSRRGDPQRLDTPCDSSQLRILTRLDSSGQPMSLPMSSEGFSLNQSSGVSLGEHHRHPTETPHSTVSLPATPYVADNGGNDTAGSFGQRWYEQHKRRHGYRPVVKRSVYKVHGVSLPL
ncbi:hypothetical protein IWQ62_001983 [Dispira parvispora]|uniref:Uncharacterized protein n=1 Tax=Dispira parvispora TaxID=1520584 RepID=A0A9W8AXS7_9FUNG|nr:hypothetical protein IWQ62_001983 [Dispira parvispora]